MGSDFDNELDARLDSLQRQRDEAAKALRELEWLRDNEWPELQLLARHCAMRLSAVQVPTLPYVIVDDFDFSNPSYRPANQNGWVIRRASGRSLTLAEDGRLYTASNIAPFPAYPRAAIIVSRQFEDVKLPPVDTYNRIEVIVFSRSSRRLEWVEWDMRDRRWTMSASELLLDSTVQLLSR